MIIEYHGILQYFLLEFLGNKGIAISEFFLGWFEMRKLFFENEFKSVL